MNVNIMGFYRKTDIVSDILANLDECKHDVPNVISYLTRFVFFK